MRVVFFGTPEFAVPTLRLLAEDPTFELSLVVTQPDRPAGRGRRSERSPVALEAARRGLPLYQPESLRSEAARAPLVAAGADLFVVAAFGLIFGRRTLAIPRLGCVNVHASLLPRFRGASPIPAAILSGDRETGVTLMLMEQGLDTGPTIAAAAEPIAPDDTTESLTSRLGRLGATLVAEALPRYADGALRPTPQPAAGASLTRPLTKADGWIDWSLEAVPLERHVRAMWPWPRAWTTFAGEPLQIHRARLAPERLEAAPGQVRWTGEALLVACGAGALRLDAVQPPGRRPMSGAAFAAGRDLSEARLGATGAPIALPPIVTPVPTP